MRYKGSLADDQCARYTRTRSIVLDGEIRVSMLVVSPKAGYWRHDHSVLESDIAELQRLKEFRGGHCKLRGLEVSVDWDHYSRKEILFIWQPTDEQLLGSWMSIAVCRTTNHC